MTVVMPILEHLRYAFYVLIVVSMVLGLGLSIAEGVGFLRNFGAMEVLISPYYIAPVYAIGFGLAPVLSERFPRKRDWQ